MTKALTDADYLSCVKDINTHESFERFKRIKRNRHHGITRYEHSLKISYYSYKIAKLLNLDAEVAAQAGLLHDFYNTRLVKKGLERMKDVFRHPKVASKNAKYIFNVSDRIHHIIAYHMFPLTKGAPKCAEGWVVSIVDKLISLKEILSNCLRRKDKRLI